MQQRSYEVMFIVRPDVTEEDLDKLSVEKMGKRRLAYDVRKFQEGQYVLFVLNADGKAVHELERRMRVAEQVIKFITVRTDEEQQRLEKVRKLRASRMKRPSAEASPAENEQPAVNA